MGLPFLSVPSLPYLVALVIPQFFGSLVLFLTENHPRASTHDMANRGSPWSSWKIRVI